eukprot:CAMPEP_0113696206 /NCGR_PEP_ID=MMETSP0038_2-20120614/21349_1 /TAXON_ID=2898 /ORGANISM="Cryptomonas paramecium" /LENGTH=202 /DNA_ID=CAMNT_0000618879 /DNA_START=1 /DNA_END=609 /DNA_ORIENTATION=- /assembly_acc=CAM_ASM_000170
MKRRLIAGVASCIFFSLLSPMSACHRLKSPTQIPLAETKKFELDIRDFTLESRTRDSSDNGIKYTVKPESIRPEDMRLASSKLTSFGGEPELAVLAQARKVLSNKFVASGAAIGVLAAIAFFRPPDSPDRSPPTSNESEGTRRPISPLFDTSPTLEERFPRIRLAPGGADGGSTPTASTTVASPASLNRQASEGEGRRERAG